MSGVTLDNVKKQYGSVDVIHGVSLEIMDGEFVVFVGPSGCGKSTLLRMIAGLEAVTSGGIGIAGKSVTGVAARDRGVAMVFQNYALYPHMSVFDNMGFGLKNIGIAKGELEKRVLAAADILQITDLLKRRPKDMSGGQRQRVAIGRAIVRDPKVFLFDEPLSNLDAALRVQMRTEITKLHHRLDATMIYVTHDQTEAMTMADRIVVLRDGVIEQSGAPLALYNRPNNKFVAGFLGSPKMNFVHGLVTAVENDIATIACECGATVRANVVEDAVSQQDPISLGVRPECFILDMAGDFSGTVELVEQLGRTALGYVKLDSGEQITVEMPSGASQPIGSLISFSVATENLHVFDQNDQSITRFSPSEDAS